MPFISAIGHNVTTVNGFQIKLLKPILHFMRPVKVKVAIIYESGPLLSLLTHFMR